LPYGAEYDTAAVGTLTRKSRMSVGLTSPAFLRDESVWVLPSRLGGWGKGFARTLLVGCVMS